jgi:hypothetical protein
MINEQTIEKCIETIGNSDTDWFEAMSADQPVLADSSQQRITMLLLKRRLNTSITLLWSAGNVLMKPIPILPR